MKPKHRNMAEVATRALRTADLDAQIEQRADEQKILEEGLKAGLDGEKEREKEPPHLQ